MGVEHPLRRMSGFHSTNAPNHAVLIRVIDVHYSGQRIGVHQTVIIGEKDYVTSDFSQTYVALNSHPGWGRLVLYGNRCNRRESLY